MYWSYRKNPTFKHGFIRVLATRISKNLILCKFTVTQVEADFSKRSFPR